MKKYFFMCLVGVAALGMTSCRDCDCRHDQISNTCYFNKQTIDLEARTTDWEFDSGANMYYVHFNLPELTSTIYNYGEVSINREYNSGTPSAYQVALPETTYRVDTVYSDPSDPATAAPVYYQQHLDYIYGVGFVEIYCTISNFYYGGFSPEEMRFRMQLTY